MKIFTFGMKTMRITQNYNSTYSHKPHWYNSKNYADYPIDLGGKDGNKDIYYATVDMKVTSIIGKANGVTNTIWLVATEKCITPSGKLTPFIMLTHWDDNDPYISRLKVGSIVKAGQEICREGVDGATSNHLHVVYGNADKGVGNGLIKNSNGKWVSNGYCMKPEEIIYVDSNFTCVKDTNNITFKEKPKEEPFFDENGYFSFGDNHTNIGKIASFMRETFPAYTSENALGTFYGRYIESAIKEFQKRTCLEVDGCVGPITLAKLKEFGFEE